MVGACGATNPTGPPNLLGHQTYCTYQTYCTTKLPYHKNYVYHQAYCTNKPTQPPDLLYHQSYCCHTVPHTSSLLLQYQVQHLYMGEESRRHDGRVLPGVVRLVGIQALKQQRLHIRQVSRLSRLSQREENISKYRYKLRQEI